MSAHYLQTGAIKIVNNSQYISKARLIPKKNGGFRLIVDLRFVNKFFKIPHFKIENLSLLQYVLKPNDYMI